MLQFDFETFPISLVRRIFSAACTVIWFIAAAISLGSVAEAQIQQPPRQEARTPTGVSFRDGSFSLQETDLSVGGGLPTGLSVTRSYSSASGGTSDPYYAAVGWTQSLNTYITNQVVPYIPRPELLQYQPPSEFDRCIYNVTTGGRSIGFRNVTLPPPPPYWGNQGLDAWRQQVGCGWLEGTYEPLGDYSGKLEFITSPSPGYYRLIGTDGSVLNFAPYLRNVLDWTMPDGTRLEFTYSNGTTGTLKSVFSNRGWAILFESEFKSCAVNTTLSYVTPTSTCPADSQTATYTYSQATYSTGSKLMTSATKGGETTQYTYDAADHINCVKAPGQTACRIQNTYGACPENQTTGSLIQPEVRAHDYVTSQTDGGGRVYTYSFNTTNNTCPYAPTFPDPDLRPFTNVTTTVAASGVSGLTTAVALPSNNVASITDPLGRTTSFAYEQVVLGDYVEDGEVMQVTNPEGNKEAYLKDARGNITDKIAIAKSGSGLANIAVHAIYPTTCANIVTCNKPTSIADALGAATDFTYDAAHGGLLTETAPVDANGVRAVKRYAYAQRYAWIKNAGGTWSQAATPVWVRTEMRTCKTTATVGNTCAGGTADEVVESYDYGPNGGAPNNLLLRGKVVSADGVSLRTCYSYDRDGRKLSETSPNANLISCP